MPAIRQKSFSLMTRTPRSSAFRCFWLFSALANAFGADDDERRLRGHFVGGEPPRRITSACASLRPSDESLPVKTTT